MKVLYIYLIIINLIAFAGMLTDKYRARRHRWRVPERALLLLTVFGGSAGTAIGMLILWHKVRNKKFVISVPVLLIVQLFLFSALKAFCN